MMLPIHLKMYHLFYSKISLWSALKKKPLHTINNAHGSDPSNQEPRWISALATLPSTDLIATGKNAKFFYR
jgi:hypothetical protein